MNIKSVKYDKGVVDIAYTAGAQGKEETITINTPEIPSADFIKAMQALPEVAFAAIPEMERVEDRSAVVKVAINKERATLTLVTSLIHFTNNLKWTTPPIPLDPQSGVLSGNQVSLVWALIKKAKDFVNGEREQEDMAFPAEQFDEGTPVDVGEDDGERFSDFEVAAALQETDACESKSGLRDIGKRFGITITCNGDRSVAEVRTELTKELNRLTN